MNTYQLLQACYPQPTEDKPVIDLGSSVWFAETEEGVMKMAEYCNTLDESGKEWEMVNREGCTVIVIN